MFLAHRIDRVGSPAQKPTVRVGGMITFLCVDAAGTITLPMYEP